MNAIVRDKVVLVTLSKRNLLGLLAKLDDPDSQRTLVRKTESGITLWIHAEPDEEHYAEREAGPMHPRTEEALRRVA